MVIGPTVPKDCNICSVVSQFLGLPYFCQPDLSLGLRQLYSNKNVHQASPTCYLRIEHFPVRRSLANIASSNSSSKFNRWFTPSLILDAIISIWLSGSWGDVSSKIHSHHVNACLATWMHGKSWITHQFKTKLKVFHNPSLRLLTWQGNSRLIKESDSPSVVLSFLLSITMWGVRVSFIKNNLLLYKLPSC